MIMQWKKQQDESYHAKWQDIDFTLFENPTTKRWCLLANGKQVRQTWHKASVAMNEIENRQQALVVEQSRVLRTDGHRRPAKRSLSAFSA